MAEMLELEEILLPNGWYRWQPKGVEKPRHLTPQEKIALEKADAVLTEKAEVRDPLCWKCRERSAYVWVREVCFDFKGEKAAPVQHRKVSSGDYPGPVPGFCLFCSATAPVELAEAVYFDRPEMAWGVKPTRWWVVFTDSSKQGGSCLELDPKQEMPTVKETYSAINED